MNAQIFKRKSQTSQVQDTIKPEMPKKKNGEKKKYSDIITDKAVTS